ncbi:hypothetical protein H7Q97_06950 [Ochrobactrum sp. CM-21-5]|nr:hypothetical protein [Ochrobactrum sp. CM-21-5]MBC2885138.1 hypothetical protein [Ochrobactrum sp. CM-21-5]
MMAEHTALPVVGSGKQMQLEHEMGEFLFWIVLVGLPVLLAFGFVFARYLKKSNGTSSHEDGA